MNTFQNEVWHTVILGSGASGLMCAGSFGAPKLVLEHNDRPGVKLNVTGGGKCNFGHLRVSERDYSCGGRHFCHNALAAFSPRDFIALMERHGIAFDEMADGRLFARDARQITQMLFLRAKNTNTSFSFDTRVLKVTRENGLFRIETSRGKVYASNVVVAAGGMSYPALGATGLAWQICRSLGLDAVPPRPVLAGLRAPHPDKEVCRALAGLSVPAAITCGRQRESGSLLFTHEGISGPPVLQLSLYWREGEEVHVNLLPDENAETYLRAHKNEPAPFSKILAPLLPAKLTKTLLGPLDTRAADASREILRAAVRRLNDWTFVPPATAGYTKAEATAGGADVRAFYPSTLECKNIPGLFFIGEALDVTGRVGGFNLHWAWASAYCAAAALAKR